MIRLSHLISESVTPDQINFIKELGSTLANKLDLYRSGSSGAYVTWTGNVDRYRITIESNGSQKFVQMLVSDKSIPIHRNQVIKAKTTIDMFPKWQISIQMENSEREIKIYEYNKKPMSFLKHVFKVAVQEIQRESI